MKTTADVAAVIDYTNHRGERAARVIQPHYISHQATEHHPAPQWIVRALDLGKDAFRDFALAGVHGWRAADEADMERLAAGEPPVFDRGAGA